MEVQHTHPEKFLTGFAGRGCDGGIIYKEYSNPERLLDMTFEGPFICLVDEFMEGRMQRLFGANKMDDKIYNECMKGLLHKEKSPSAAAPLRLNASKSTKTLAIDPLIPQKQITQTGPSE